MSDVTKLLGNAAGGDSHSVNQLYDQVYAELRAIAGQKMASERPGHTLQRPYEGCQLQVRRGLSFFLKSFGSFSFPGFPVSSA